MITGAPQLDFVDQFYWTAYKRLRACASYGGQIPWTAINEYGKENGLQGDELEEFVTVIELVSEGHNKYDRENDPSAKKPLPGNRITDQIKAGLPKKG